MKKLLLSTSLAILTLAVFAASGAGCKKKGGDSKAEASPATSESTLPGAAEVMAAVNAKDYDKAAQTWAGLRASVSGNDQIVQFTVLTKELKMKLMDVSETDPKAAKALAAIQALTSGR